MDEIIKLAKRWENGGTVENPKWLLRELITGAERMNELRAAYEVYNTSLKRREHAGVAASRLAEVAAEVFSTT